MRLQDLNIIILCIDMDAYFASVEQQANPKLRGKPIAVIGSGARTIIVTRSYEARKFGVKTGMNIYEAKKLCPALIFVVGDNEKYTYTCTELEKIYRRYTPEIEVYSIDEAFLDITTTHHLFGGPKKIGVAIKKEIVEKFGINCTVGIAPNILLAKLASDIAKPDGLKWISPEDISVVLEDLPVSELWGIGSKLSAKLEQLNIRTCGDLGRAPASLLRNKFGITGETLKMMGQGICTRSLITKEEDPKSIGHSMTRERNISDRKEIEMYMLKLAEMVGRRARKYGFEGRKVSLTIRYPDFETFTRQMTLPEATNHTHEIYKNALLILDEIKLRDSVRLIGICLSSLMHSSDQQMLFRDRAKRKDLLTVMDALNDKFGSFKLIWASCMKRAGEQKVISPAWRPSGVRNTKVK